MIKYTITLISFAGLFLYNLIMVDLKVSSNIPSEVTAGNEFTFEINISKGDVSGFAKIQQDLPDGFTAEIIDSKGASFSFVGNKVKFIWMSLPAEQDFTVSYKVKVGQEVQGNFDIAGKFAYLENNERKSIDIPSASISVNNNKATAEVNDPPQTNKVEAQPESADDQATQQKAEEKQEATTSNNTEVPKQEATNTATTSNTTTAANQPVKSEEKTASAAPAVATQPQATTAPAVQTNGAINCSRTFTKQGTDYIVNISIQNNGVTGFAKVQDVLPDGLTAEEDKSNNAVFSFVGKKSKFVWMSLPSDNPILISYRLKGASEIDLPLITGEFAFLENNDSKKIPIISLNLPKNNNAVAVNTPAQATNNQPASTTTTPVKEEVKEEVKETPATAPANNPVQTTSKTTESAALAENKPKEATKIEEPVKSNATNTETKPAAAKTTTPKATTPTASTNNKASYTPSPQKGIGFSVQICAGHENIKDVPTHFKKVYKFDEETININNHEGWIKYTVGEFDQYQNARDRRNALTNGYSFPGPFVTAYNNGNRITVQEALMLNKDRWVP